MQKLVAGADIDFLKFNVKNIPNQKYLINVPSTVFDVKEKIKAEKTSDCVMFEKSCY